MTYQVLYRKYRPDDFDEVVGQKYVVKTLLNAIKVGKVSHAYLFCGPRGTGKTSIAKLFAKTLNCTSEDKRPCGECDNCKAFLSNNHPDIIELDAASNNSVDDIRDITERAAYQPILGKYKVYILDEVHMLSQAAANALLKTLEEPPAHVIFILATTDPQKIIPTILSRCQRYNFAKLTNSEMKERMKTILKNEDIAYQEEALDIICDLSDGCMRDALSILDEVLAYGDYHLVLEDVEKMFGLLTMQKKIDLIKDIKNHKIDKALAVTKELYHEGGDLKLLTQDLIKIYKDTIIYKETANRDLLTVLAQAEAEDLAQIYENEDILEAIDILMKALENYRSGQDVMSVFEVVILKLAKTKTITKKEDKKSEIFDEEISEEPLVVKKEEVKLTLDEVDISNDQLLYILMNASKEEKVKDCALYSKITNYSLDPEKRRYFYLLKDTEIFASGKDMIIFSTPNNTTVRQINDRMNNQDLYYFLQEEFGIEKMLVAVNEERKRQLVTMFKTLDKQTPQEYVPQRYPKRQKADIGETLKDLFGNVEIREE